MSVIFINGGNISSHFQEINREENYDTKRSHDTPKFNAERKKQEPALNKKKGSCARAAFL
jgi:hypothetical protein